MDRSAFLTVGFTLIALTLSAAGAGTEWPGWLGPHRDSKADDTGLLTSWPTNGPTLAWKVAGLGQGFSGATVVGGAIYTTGLKEGHLYLIALNMDGSPKWSKDVEAGFVDSHPGSRSSPTYDDGNLYLETDLGTVGCYDAATGAQKWTRKLSEFGGRPPNWGFAESVLVTGELAIVTPGGTNCIVALDRKTGATVWGSEAFAGAHYSSPILVHYQGVAMIINGTQGGLIAVDAKTGKKLWTNAFSAGNTANCPTPAFADGYVFWANGYGKGGICLKLNAQDGKVTAEEAWRSGDMVCHHGGYVIQDGYIYGNNGNGWACLEVKSGQKKWQEEAVGKGSLCYADGMLFLFGEKGGRVGFGLARPTGFKLAGEFAVQGKGPSWAHPVIAGGRLYLRYDDNLYAYGLKAQ
jgi:outer membrane protein assembly factor BamB